MADTNTLLERYQPWRRVAEYGFWIVVLTLNAIANSVVALMDVRRAKLDAIAWWEPAVWEFSSTVTILALMPAVVAFTRRYPLHFDTWRRFLPHYVAATVVWSIGHVVGMVSLRMGFYALVGYTYDFGSWPREFFYEYLKDARSFISFVVLVTLYRFVLLRLQGEAALLDAPDVGPPLESVERPERFLVRKLNREFLVAANDIEWVQASGNYANLHVRGRDYPLRSTIAGVEARLDPARFARVHRSYIVNLDHVSMIEPLDTGDARLHLKDGTTVPCSRRYRPSLRERVGAAAAGE
ncbi:LytTR family DNA-binding domain-containing protein [Tahibacter soli]|uniref:LytTR family DNA-binding domain-containing protein n=1 Tax=Tahibacter soli TaxID=2983605 RepID=A0A9X3YKC9_9GAMM|nr:LytTR family DNA-binding domain-containing protein [Tahibacter soli]MDC8012398.1 LytTR family DNA-binding domain-containing protein [Tahibacter soli]